jgi:hypothetical protein
MSYTNGLDKPSDYFNTKLYTGNNTTNHSITGVGFQPDWVWIKSRNSTDQHNVYDIVRGATKRLVPNTTAAEDTNTETIKSFDSDGFTLGNAGNVNDNYNYVSWNWLASNTTASNTDGSITSTVSANTASGFSIATYTGNGTAGADIGHGLGDTPACVIIKPRTTTGNDNWIVYHKSLGTGNYLYLNTTDASSSAGGAWLTPSSSTIEFTQSFAVTNNSGSDFVCYSFAEKKGYSKFGSYTGNGSSDGSFIFTGFKPAWLVVKNIVSSTDSWHTKNNKSSPFNVVDDALYLNMNIAELTNNSALNVDFLSNGFKLRTNNTASNGSGTSYIYLAFAENPFVTSTGIPTTAR